VSVLAEVPFPPSVGDFYLPSLAAGYWVTKFTLMVWLAVAVLIVFFLVAYRDPKIVPTRGQWLAESVYGFARDSMAKDLIGHEGVRFAPYLATLFSFILVTNVFGVVPLLQVSPNAHIAFPVVLGLISYVLFMYQGMRRHGVGKFLKKMAVTNMFAGHLILLVFTLGGFALFASGNFFYYAVGGVSLVFAIVMTLFEFGIALLQAYVFVLLTGFYVGDALAESH
jgi:F-type H+-transporting ATPase subunit a